MCLGALVDAGVPLEYLKTQLDRLGIAAEYRLRSAKVHHNGQIATKVYVDLTATQMGDDRSHSHPHSHHPTPASGVARDLEHSPPHPHPHEHPHSHGHPHPHEHPHSHEHPHPHPHEHPHSHEHPHPHSHGHPHPHPHSHEHLHPHDRAATTISPSQGETNPVLSRFGMEASSAERAARSTIPNPQSNYDSPQRNLPQIEQLITAANLPARAAQWSLDVFRQLAIAEGAVHGIDPTEVHFHEVGAVDAIVDIVGTCLGLDYLQVDRIYCSALPTGGGTVRAAHGILPVPVPAVLKLFSARQVPLYSNGIDRELVTPTGAALAVTLASEFGAAPPMQLAQIGLGAGTIELPIPNILRLWLGIASDPVAESQVRAECIEAIEVLSTQIDDMNPQAIGYIFDRLFAAGALDVFTQSIGMKKSRPGILLTVICPVDRAGECEQIIFTETSTLGVRRDRQTRSILPRSIDTVTSKYGEIRVKIARNNLVNNDRIINVHPEYEDCIAAAKHHQVSWQEVERAAIVAWEQNRSDL
jgi:pyridinium-3,5-bisthiocarboxylic acid mononucleotide nickel chelatase